MTGKHPDLHRDQTPGKPGFDKNPLGLASVGSWYLAGRARSWSPRLLFRICILIYIYLYILYFSADNNVCGCRRHLADIFMGELLSLKLATPNKWSELLYKIDKVKKNFFLIFTCTLPTFRSMRLVLRKN